ncbi:MAG: hypothetical protein B6240_00595 [Desulfobacteraceae bacterium 4572_87]|nr:MAG: hypothetical protein B6240_00595 [Desulfobacteraceae bacterium 4572_87]
MDWNIFSSLVRAKHFSPLRKRGKAKDSFDACIQLIETFAPREHLSERKMFYYNYKMMSSCRKPLTSLLETLSQNKGLKTDPHEHARRLFLHLKDFYDPKGTLSLTDALGEKNLIRRFRDLYLYFYNRKKISREEIEEWLKSIETKSGPRHHENH